MKKKACFLQNSLHGLPDYEISSLPLVRIYMQVWFNTEYRLAIPQFF